MPPPSARSPPGALAVLSLPRIPATSSDQPGSGPGCPLGTPWPAHLRPPCPPLSNAALRARPAPASPGPAPAMPLLLPRPLLPPRPPGPHLTGSGCFFSCSGRCQAASQAFLFLQRASSVDSSPRPQWEGFSQVGLYSLFARLPAGSPPPTPPSISRRGHRNLTPGRKAGSALSSALVPERPICAEVIQLGERSAWRLSGPRTPLLGQGRPRGSRGDPWPPTAQPLREG